MSTIRWLQISDLHYGYESYVTSEMRTNMLKSLPTILKDLAMPEYLFITGDLRYGKNCGKIFPGEIVDNIRNLMNAFNISPEHVHIVMGNHDVIHELSRKDIAPLIRKDYLSKNGYLDEERMKSLELSQHQFYEIYKSVCGREPVPYHNLVEEKDFNIICLNTAFACSGDGEEGDLIVGMMLVKKALENINASKPGIVLAHHGFESLQTGERGYLEIKLKESGVLLYLCGHEHLADCRNIAARRENQQLLEYVCGTGMDKLQTSQPAEMVVFLGEMDTEKKNGFIRAWEWRDRSGAWLPYPDISYKQTGLSDGCHYFPRKPDQKAIVPALREEAIKRYKDYLLYECGEIRLDGMPADDKAGSKTLELEKLFIPTNFDKGNNSKQEGYISYIEVAMQPFIRKRLDYSAIKRTKALLDEIENGTWNQYYESDLFRIERALERTINTISLKYSKMKINSLLKRTKLLMKKLHEINLIIPSVQSGFSRVILSGPGGGKTTLLKRLAMAYAFPQRREDPEIDDNLPDRELLPIFIRCRDLKAKALYSIAEIIEGIPLRAEFRPDRPELVTAFLAEVFECIQEGKALLLMDGLDEITDKSLRKSFAEEIARFAQLNPNVNIIITSRIAGFEAISDGKLRSFPQAYISKLNKDDIKLLCRRWHKVIYANREDIISQADALTNTILSHKKIRDLAGSPLLLTTLLLVQRRVGRLPTRRIALYEESVKVLLETWNLEAYEPIELETAKCQLAYVAFEMIHMGIQTIGRRELESLLKNVRKEQSWLPSKLESPGAFLERVELRSSLLVKRGYRKTDTGMLEEEYEFQHLTFQEYLAAFAIVNGYYPEADQQSNYLDALENFYLDENKEEIILLTAAQANRKGVTHITESIIDMINKLDSKKKDSNNKMSFLRNLLIKILLDEVQLIEEARNLIFSVVTEKSLYQNQIPFFKDVLKSNHGEEFRAFLKKSKWGNIPTALDLSEKDDPIGKCIDLINAGGSSSENLLGALNSFYWVLFVMNVGEIKNRLTMDGLLESILNLLVKIIMESIDDKEALRSADCLYWILKIQTIVKFSQEWIPDGFTWRLINLIYKSKKIGTCVRVFEKLPVNKEIAMRLLCLDCSHEIKQFFSDSLAEVDYSYKAGVYWAAVLVGAWNWDEAEAILENVFMEEGKVFHKGKKERLQIFKTATESKTSLN